MGPKIALVSLAPKGSQFEFMSRLYLGLSMYTEARLIRGPTRSSRVDRLIRKERRLISEIVGFDIAIVQGIVTLFTPFKVPVSGIYIPGYVLDDMLISGLLHGNSLKARVNSMFSFLVSSLISKKIINFILCHSNTACDTSMKTLSVNAKRVIIPQFFLKNDINYLINIKRYIDNFNFTRIKILSYISGSPYSRRLLPREHIIQIFKTIKKYVNKSIELNIIDPRVKRKEAIISNNDFKVTLYPRMSKESFLRFMAKHHLVFERNLDEEISFLSLEAAAMGIPISKLTAPEYWFRQDYTRYFIVDSNPYNIIEKLKEYLQKIDYYYEYYSRKSLLFVKSKRCWEAMGASVYQSIIKTAKAVLEHG